MIYTDNQIIQLFLPIINSGLISFGYNNVAVVQANQPTIEGINTTPTVYFYKVGNTLDGNPGWLDEWNGLSMDHSETQYYSIRFKVFAMVLQYPVTPNQYTASDLVNAVASIMQSQNTVFSLTAAGVNVFKISEIDNPYFIDDKDIYEATPSFDFILSYKNVRIFNQPVVEQPIGFNIQAV